MTSRVTTRNHAIKMEKVLTSLSLPAAHEKLDVLEVGAGFGGHAAGIVQTGHRYVGVDLSEGNLRRSLALHPGLAGALLIAGDAMRLPFEDCTFDAAFYVASLHHIPDPRAAVHEMMRVLKPGGAFCILEPRRAHPVHFLAVLAKLKTEISALKMKTAAVKQWVIEAGASELSSSHCVYTPNRPASLVPLYNKFDAFCISHPALNCISMMFCVRGKK